MYTKPMRNYAEEVDRLLKRWHRLGAEYEGSFLRFSGLTLIQYNLYLYSPERFNEHMHSIYKGEW